MKLRINKFSIKKFNSIFDVIVSTDKSGMIEYWTGPNNDYKFPKNVNFESKMDTDLYEYAKVIILLVIELQKKIKYISNLENCNSIIYSKKQLS